VSEKHIKNFVYISTGGAIYGDPADLPAYETTIERPISPYGLSKLVGEKYIQLFHEIRGIPYSIIRPANIYGPRQDPMGEAGVISIFLGRLMNNQPLKIFGDGYDTRDYIYVEDIADICLKVMESPITDIFNAGTGKQTNLLELVNLIKKITKLPAEKQFSPPRPGDVQHIALNISKARKMLNWSPKTELTEGLVKTWDWFRSN
ncbi:MAG: NAD-dependent epimerase/dehydratase family protein, partial [Candidatus Hodarchaeota archaeon]